MAVFFLAAAVFFFNALVLFFDLLVLTGDLLAQLLLLLGQLFGVGCCCGRCGRRGYAVGAHIHAVDLCGLEVARHIGIAGAAAGVFPAEHFICAGMRADKKHA